MLDHHRLILALAVIVTVISALLASRLHIDNDLRALLPDDHPVIQSLERTEAAFQSTGSVDLLVRGGTPDARHTFADTIVERLRPSPLIAAAEDRLASDFFIERALYYLSDEEYESLEDHVQAWSHQELCAAQPDVCLDAPDLKAREKLQTFVRDKQREALDRAGFRDYFERDGLDALVILIHPRGRTSDLEFSRQISDFVRAEVATLKGESPAWAELDVHAIGPYVVKADEHATILADMVSSGTFGVVGVIIVLLALFRSTRAALTLLVPLLFGVTWAVGATQLVLGHLNTITSMIATVVMGMGIDAGIHFLLRARSERRTHDDRTAIRLAFEGLIVPLLVATGTTLGAFVVMGSSSFPAFREFGIIAVLGVGLCLLSMVTVFPALLCLVGIKPPRRAPPPGDYGRVAGAVLARPGALFLVIAIASVAAVFGAQRVEFENNGRMLQSEARRARVAESREVVNKIFDRDIHAGVLVVDTLEQSRSVLDYGRARWEERKASGDTLVADLYGAPDLLPDPAIDMDARAEAIEELADDIPESAWDKLEERAQAESGYGDGDGDKTLTPEEATRLKAMLRAKPVTIDSLPPALLRAVRSQNQDGEKFAIYAYPNFDAAEIIRGVDFTEETQSFIPDDAGLTIDKEQTVFVGETTVYATMYLLMRSEAPLVIGAAAALVTLLVFAQLRSITFTVITVLPLILGMFWLAAVMGFAELRFTLFNIPILPAILGIGVDNGVYLTDRIRRLKDEPNGIARALHETGAAILAATTTTGIGFASFIIADNGGLHGIGVLAVLGIAIAALTAVLLVPTLSALLLRERRG